MSMFVKICGLRSEDGIAAAVAAGANAVGFVFAESPRQVTPDEARSLSGKVPDGVLRVAVMRHPSNDEWQSVLDTVAPDVLQTDIADFATLEVPEHIRAWPVIREGDEVNDWPAEFVYEGRQSGVGETVDWAQAARIAGKGRMILAGGLDSGNVAAAVREVSPWGVDVSSGVESSPGVKDSDKIRSFINAARTAETTA